MTENYVDDEFRHIMTVDVEDWFSSSVDLFKEANNISAPRPSESVVSNTLNCLAILNANKSKATFFILTTVCEHYPDLIQEIINQGHEIGMHGYEHRLLYNMTKDQFKSNIEKSLTLLAKCGVSSVKGYRAPYWSITKNSLWAIDILKSFGFSYDSSIFPIRRGLYGIPDSPTTPYQIMENFWEFPPSTVKIFNQNIPIAGGGYLRLLPLKFILANVNKLQKNKITGVFYFHPYELDNRDINLKIKLTKITSILYYLQQISGRKKNVIKLIKFLNIYKFMSIETALRIMVNQTK